METSPHFTRVGNLQACNRVLTPDECEAMDRAAAQARADARTKVRQALDAGISPFHAHRDKILGFHSTALRLQTVVLNLYNDGYWAKKAPVHLSSLIANADAEHLEILVDLIRSYARHGENDPEFMALGQLLAKARQPKPRQAKGAA